VLLLMLATSIHVTPVHAQPSTLPAVITLGTIQSLADSTAKAGFHRRMEWRSTRAYVLDSAGLQRYRGVGLDILAGQLGVRFAEYRAEVRSAGPTSINSQGRSRSERMVGNAEQMAVAGDACMLIDGQTQSYRPLHTVRADDIDFLEVYPSRSEDTRTVAEFMHGPCALQANGDHRTWFVIWTKLRR
jgi:hypothetical protein